MSYSDTIIALNASYQAEVERRGFQFKETPAINELISATADWLCNPNGKRGLFLSGDCGNGKTTMLQAISSLVDYLSKFKGYVEFPEEIDLATHPFGIGITIATAKELCTDNNTWACKSSILAIDDLGCEPAELKVYGNIISPLADLLMYRYEQQLVTIISTNIRPKDIAERYGERLADRCREMYKIVEFRDESFRSSLHVKE